MSDYVLKIIPTDRRYLPDPQTYAPALKLLLRVAPGEMPEARASEKLRYIDAGDHLERIVCPRCGSQLSAFEDPHREWCWQLGEELAKRDVEAVTAIVPCCNVSVFATELEFQDGGFARFELVIWNPDLSKLEVPASGMAQLETLLGCTLRQVWARY